MLNLTNLVNKKRERLERSEEESEGKQGFPDDQGVESGFEGEWDTWSWKIDRRRLIYLFI